MRSVTLSSGGVVFLEGFWRHLADGLDEVARGLEGQDHGLALSCDVGYVGGREVGDAGGAQKALPAAAPTRMVVCLGCQSVGEEEVNSVQRNRPARNTMS
eukprot:COSAG01_NODE_5534_length_4201_cov_48.592150_2_plen_100_part_00